MTPATKTILVNSLILVGVLFLWDKVISPRVPEIGKK